MIDGAGTSPTGPMNGTDAGEPRGLLVLICTYNERHTLPVLVEQILRLLPEAHILVVDDGSPDGTGEWAAGRQQADPRLRALVRPGKRGLGTAIREGMRHAIQHRYAWLVNLDGDLSHDPQAIAQMTVLQAECDIAIGSRYVAGGALRNCSWRRVVISRSANILARAIVGWEIQDCSSAFRMYRVAVLEGIALDGIQATGYGFLEEVLALILREGGRVIETPITYTEREHGTSKLSLREAWSTLSALIRIGRIVRGSGRRHLAP